MLAHACSALNIGFSFDRLYEGVDEDYELCLRVLVDAESERNRTQQ